MMNIKTEVLASFVKKLRELSVELMVIVDEDHGS